MVRPRHAEDQGGCSSTSGAVVPAPTQVDIRVERHHRIHRGESRQILRSSPIAATSYLAAQLIEEQRQTPRKAARRIEFGQIRKGVVKNIAEFGASRPGGIDGLLHITT